MKKCEEREIRDSCWNKAGENELVFVILARDLAAPAAIRAWCKERIRLGKNEPMDAQIQEALDLAEKMPTDRLIRELHADTMKKLNP